MSNTNFSHTPVFTLCLKFLYCDAKLLYYDNSYKERCMCKDYKEILEKNPDYRVLDGHLVDIIDTLVQGGKLNKTLYDSMLKAEEKGEPIYLYSAGYSPEHLQELGVDTDKFPILSKQKVFGSYNIPCIVLGKVVDDCHPVDQRLEIVLADEKDGYVYPNKQEYSFVRKEISQQEKNERILVPGSKTERQATLLQYNHSQFESAYHLIKNVFNKKAA